MPVISITTGNAYILMVLSLSLCLSSIPPFLFLPLSSYFLHTVVSSVLSKSQIPALVITHIIIYRGM